MSRFTASEIKDMSLGSYPTSRKAETPEALVAELRLFHHDRAASMLDSLTKPPEPSPGLCGDHEEHDPHIIAYVPVTNGPMSCHADQSRRLTARRWDSKEPT